MQMSGLSLSLSLCLSCLVLNVSGSEVSDLSDLQGNCAVGWLDGGATLGCIYLDNTARTWMDSVMFCRALTVSGVTNTTYLAKMDRSVGEGTRGRD